MEILDILTQKEKILLKSIFRQLDTIAKIEEVYPSPSNILRAVRSIDQPKVVILGQDPYPTKGDANGLAFAVNPGVKPPPSLQNILKEVLDDTGCVETHPDLLLWEKQGVVLLNTILSVSQGKPGSHSHLGWQKITNRIIYYMSTEYENLVFILWGKVSQSRAHLIDEEKHHIIQSPHPSPLAAYRGFFGSKPFSKTNHYLKGKNINEILW